MNNLGLYTGGDVLTVANEMQNMLDNIQDPEMYELAVQSGLAVINGASIGYTGPRKLFIRSDLGFQTDSEGHEVDELEFAYGRIDNVVCQGVLKDVVWIGDLAIDGYAARMVSARVRTEELPEFVPVPESVILPVKTIREYHSAS